MTAPLEMTTYVSELGGVPMPGVTSLRQALTASAGLLGMQESGDPTARVAYLRAADLRRLAETALAIADELEKK